MLFTYINTFCIVNISELLENKKGNYKKINVL